MSLKSFKTFLVEALLDVDKADIDKIYSPLKVPFKELSDVWKRNFERFTSTNGDEYSRNAIARTIQRELNEVLTKYQPVYGPLKTFKSSELKSPNAKKAHAINPIEIHVWLVGPRDHGNVYDVKKKEIHICLDRNVADAMINRLASIPHYQLPMLRNEVSDLKLKTTIRHEVAHWMDDSLHNLYLTKSLTKTMEIAREKGNEVALKARQAMVTHGEPDIYLAPIELTAMVNQIAEYKRRVTQKKYDSLTWKQLMTEIPSLNSLNKAWGARWRKKMFERLSRENLIGKNFRKELE